MRAVVPVVGLLALAIVGCGKDSTAPGSDTNSSASCPGINLGPAPSRLALPQASPAALATLGNGLDTVRYTAEVAVRGTIAYMTSWSVRRVQGNKVSIWDVSGNVPVLVDSLIVNAATTTGDVAVSDDGSLLVVATERIPGQIVVYDLTNPRRPVLISTFTNANTNPGVHTAEVGRVNGKLYAFLAIDPGGTVPARLVTVDLSNPAAPTQVYTKVIGNPYVHDTFVRDGLLFLALWDDGVQIWDIGGCGTEATPEAPRVLGGVKTLGGEVHNIWWYHDASGSKRFAFVGQEGFGVVPTQSSGDIHVLDISDLTNPKEVAFYTVPGAGTHNFSVDETNGVLYAA
ncbi:MAG: LVIVD repeat-containing protein [Gemmatimonadaceae bacterium]